ncbi:hypothetical protein Hanom_Chr07g00598211 [Helianthus anomalus]
MFWVWMFSAKSPHFKGTTFTFMFVHFPTLHPPHHQVQPPTKSVAGSLSMRNMHKKRGYRVSKLLCRPFNIIVGHLV